MFRNDLEFLADQQFPQRMKTVTELAPDRLGVGVTVLKQ